MVAKKNALAKTQPKPKPAAPSGNGATPTVQAPANGPTPSGKPRSGIGSMFGSPAQGGNNLAKPVTEVTRDHMNWLAQGDITDEQHANFTMWYAEDMALNGDIDLEKIAFFTSQFRRSVNNKSWDTYKDIAIAEQRKKDAAMAHRWHQAGDGAAPVQAANA